MARLHFRKLGGCNARDGLLWKGHRTLAGCRLFLGPGKRKQGLDEAAGSMGIERAAQSQEMAREKVIETSVRGKVGDAASLLAKMRAPEANRQRDEPL